MKKTNKFIQALWLFLMDPSNMAAARWVDNHAFQIVNTALFQQMFIKIQTKCQSLQSFTRQLHMYDFRPRNPYEKKQKIWCNDHFRMENASLEKVTRKKENKKRKLVVSGTKRESCSEIRRIQKVVEELARENKTIKEKLASLEKTISKLSQVQLRVSPLKPCRSIMKKVDFGVRQEKQPSKQLCSQHPPQVSILDVSHTQGFQRRNPRRNSRLLSIKLMEEQELNPNMLDQTHPNLIFSRALTYANQGDTAVHFQ